MAMKNEMKILGRVWKALENSNIGSATSSHKIKMKEKPIMAVAKKKLPIKKTAKKAAKKAAKNSIYEQFPLEDKERKSAFAGDYEKASEMHSKRTELPIKKSLRIIAHEIRSLAREVVAHRRSL